VNAKNVNTPEAGLISSPHLLYPGPLKTLDITISNPTSALLTATSAGYQEEKELEAENSPTTIINKKLNAVQSLLAQPVPFTPLTLTSENTADIHLLTEEEKKLCSMLAIYPKPYLVIKDILFKEAMRQGGTLKKKQAKELCKIDPAKVSKIHDFFISCGWIGKV